MVKRSATKKRLDNYEKCKIAQRLKQHIKDVKTSLKGCQSNKESTLPVQVSIDSSVKDKNIEEAEQLKKLEKEHEKKRTAALRLLNHVTPVDKHDVIKAKMIKDSSRAFIGDFRKLLEESDVILEVLDARDPMGTRSMESEKLIKAANKTLIFVLNKIDLVPLDNMKAWVACLSKEAKTFPLKASCQEQARKLGSSNGTKFSCDVSGTSGSFGIDTLINHLKSLNKRVAGSNVKSANKLVIGVAGVPNTGKSSVINSMKRKRICEAGNVAGMTRTLQHIALDNHIELVDSPGIVLAQSSDPAEFALRNCVRVEKIEDPVSVAEAIYRRSSVAQLQYLYKLQDCSIGTCTEFMVAFATRMCPLRKGGIPDLNLAAVRLITDWNSGKIQYYTDPPVSTDKDMATEDTLQFLFQTARPTGDKLADQDEDMDL